MVEFAQMYVNEVPQSSVESAKNLHFLYETSNFTVGVQLTSWDFGKMTTQLKIIYGYHGCCAVMVKNVTKLVFRI